jgi:hypothetical protein
VTGEVLNGEDIDAALQQARDESTPRVVSAEGNARLGRAPSDNRVHGRRSEAARRREADALRALATLADRLPEYLTPDEREDAVQQIALDILSGKLTADGLTPVVLRRYAAEARGMVNNRFRFTSLSNPTSDGREFGEWLAA